MKPRASDLGIEIGRLPRGAGNAITDVAGVQVGHTTLIEGDDVRTGVTVVLQPPEPLFAGCHRINGNGELTGLEWIRDSGLLTTPVALTNTHSVGVVRDSLIAYAPPGEDTWSLPVVGETWDGFLNDINGFHVRAEHVRAALESAVDGPVGEGAVGGGTGMICHGFKGGIGTASRVVEDDWTVGALVQANHGARRRLRVNGAPVGERIGPEQVPLPGPREGTASIGTGSIIVILATDAPLLPGQCERLARRTAFGIARTGGLGEHSSGDFALCFATGNRGLQTAEPELALRMVNDDRINELYEAVVDIVEESIVNALLAAETMTGHDGHTAYALPHDLLQETLSY